MSKLYVLIVYSVFIFPCFEPLEEPLMENAIVETGAYICLIIFDKHSFYKQYLYIFSILHYVAKDLDPYFITSHNPLIIYSEKLKKQWRIDV